MARTPVSSTSRTGARSMALTGLRSSASGSHVQNRPHAVHRCTMGVHDTAQQAIAQRQAQAPDIQIRILVRRLPQAGSRHKSRRGHYPAPLDSPCTSPAGIR